jgi:hypothetical protein
MGMCLQHVLIPNKNEPCFALLFWHATFYIHNLIIRTTT